MTPPLPGARLHRLLLRWAPPAVVRDVVEPTIADLQFEADRARTAVERKQVIFRGYVAVCRALVFSIERSSAIRAALALSALCAVGTALVTAARAAHVDGRLLSSALLAPVMLTPLVLRMLGTTSSRRLFVGTLLVAMLTLALANGLALDDAQPVWVRLMSALAMLVVFTPMAAAAAIVVGPGRETFPKRALTAVALGGSLATAAFLVARRPYGEHLSVGLAMTPFYVTLFAALFSLTLLPLLLVARAFITRPSLLAIASLICSPAPVIAGSYLDHGTLTACLDTLRHTPFAFTVSSLPFVIGALAVGWRLPRG